MFVMKRLDARYDWLPSPYKLKPKHNKVKVKFFGDGCKKKGSGTESSTYSGKILLVSREGNCSYFEKVNSGLILVKCVCVNKRRRSLSLPGLSLDSLID